jgi:hypothetical protein
MLPAVKFDDQSIVETNEIDDVWTNGSLPFELEPLKAVRAQLVPKPLLRAGHSAAQLLG